MSGKLSTLLSTTGLDPMSEDCLTGDLILSAFAKSMGLLGSASCVSSSSKLDWHVFTVTTKAQDSKPRCTSPFQDSACISLLTPPWPKQTMWQVQCQGLRPVTHSPYSTLPQKQEGMVETVWCWDEDKHIDEGDRKESPGVNMYINAFN